MFLHAANRWNDLDIRRRAKLQVNAFPAEMLHEFRILDAARSVADALRVEQAQRLPHALRAKPFARVRGAEQAMLSRVTIRTHMPVQRKSASFSRKIDRHAS